MPLFSIYCKDVPGSVALRNQFRDQHVPYIKALDDAGKIFFSGPLKDDAGTSVGVVIIFEAEDKAAAQRWVDGDPYVKGGVYATKELFAVRKAFPA